VKKESRIPVFGGGGMKTLRFTTAPNAGDIAQLKASGKVLTVTIGAGLPKNTRMSSFHRIHF